GVESRADPAIGLRVRQDQNAVNRTDHAGSANHQPVRAACELVRTGRGSELKNVAGTAVLEASVKRQFKGPNVDVSTELAREPSPALTGRKNQRSANHEFVSRVYGGAAQQQQHCGGGTAVILRRAK